MGRALRRRYGRARGGAPLDSSKTLEGSALLIIDPYPLADSVNFRLSFGEVPLQFAERWLARTLSVAEVKLERHHGDRFTVWLDGIRQHEQVEIKVQARK
jgi:hypothetical protein